MSSVLTFGVHNDHYTEQYYSQWPADTISSARLLASASFHKKAPAAVPFASHQLPEARIANSTCSIHSQVRGALAFPPASVKGS
jgi:hypothetical protein